MIINNYKHNKGKNCESSAIRNVLTSYGTSVKEEIILGLDSGFGFMFFENQNDKIDIVLGKNEIFSCKSLNFLGVKFEKFDSITRESGWTLIKKNYLDKEIPVIIRVDNALLQYWDVPIEANFGGYYMVIIGYDENDNFYISDSEFEDVKLISSKELSVARSSTKCPPINPNNELYVLSKPSREPDISKVGPAAIRNTCRNFIASPMNNVGLKGILMFKKAMKEWASKKQGIIIENYKDGSTLEMSTLLFQLKQAGRYIVGSGTGGSCYRQIFAEFLYEVYTATNQNIYQECYHSILESGKIWQDIGEVMFNVTADTKNGEVNDMITLAIDQVDKIHQLEKNAFSMLRRI